MSLLILLLCSLPPLGVIATALVHAARTRNPAALTMMILSASIITASVVLPLTEDAKPVRSVRFTAPGTHAVVSAHGEADPVRLARRSETQAMYQ